MSYTVHNIIIGLPQGRANIKGMVEQIMGNLTNNLRNNQEEFIEFATKQTEYIAKLEAKRFAFQGKLEKSINHKIFRKAKRGEVFIQGNANKQAIMNEFGVTNPVNYKGHSYAVKMTPLLSKWAFEKAPQWIGKEFVVVGKPGTRSHVIAPNPRNRFWSVTQQLVEKDIDNMFAHYLTKAIEMS